MPKKSMPASPAASAWVWPPLRICVEVDARGNEAKEAGVSPQPKGFVASVDSKGVGAMMGALGWTGAPGEKPQLAAASLEQLVTLLVEQACMLAGADYPSRDAATAAKALEGLDQGWEKALSGQAPWRVGALASGLSSQWSAALARDSSGSGAASASARAAALLARHEAAAQAFASTLADQMARLGASPSVAKRGMREGPAPSKLPPSWDWGKLGAAVCVEMEDASTACAFLPRSFCAAVERSPLGMAFGAWLGLKLLGEHPAMREVLGAGASGMSFSSRPLRGDLALEHFPCIFLRARQAWRGEAAAASQEALEAMRIVGAGRWEASLAMPSPEVGMRRVSAQEWLDAVSDSISAGRLARKLARVAKEPEGEEPAGGAKARKKSL